MASSFEELVSEIDSFKIPSRLEKFLVRERAPSLSEQTLSFYAYSYKQGFETFAGAAADGWYRGLVQLPLFYLARHSIELHLKEAIEDFVSYNGEPTEDHGHHLLRLWDELHRQFALAGMPPEDEWGKHCTRLLNHIHHIDPTGEAFRYPHNLAGRKFEYTRVQLEGLVKAHEHITGYCGASLDMLSEGKSNMY